jgi:hypothetical protein
MPTPSEEEKAAGAKKFLIADDLTTPTYRKLQELLQHDQVAKAWTMSGCIWYVLVGENQPAKRVKSVFDDISSYIT